MHVSRIAVKNWPPIKELDLNSDRHVNLLIGPNASGKSTILRELFDRLSTTDESEAPTDDSHPWFSVTLSSDWQTARTVAPPSSVVPVVYIPAIRVSLEVADVLPYGHEGFDDPFQMLFHARQEVLFGQLIESALEASVLDAIVNPVHRCFIDICPEVLTGDSVISWLYGVPFYGDDGRGLIKKGIFYGAPGTELLGENIRNAIDLQDMSSGTQDVLLWIWALALKIAHHYNWEVGWEDKPSILLIDEIENHLHPSWQRRVIPTLRRHFPGLQIFATTHSPFVVAGQRAGQVHQLRRDTHGTVTGTTNNEDIIGWTTDEISQRWLEIRTPTDLTIIEWSDRLMELRRQETLAPDEEEELNDLRRRVNVALFSGMEEHEGYEAEIESFLRTRESELTQDGA